MNYVEAVAKLQSDIEQAMKLAEKIDNKGYAKSYRDLRTVIRDLRKGADDIRKATLEDQPKK